MQTVQSHVNFHARHLGVKLCFACSVNTFTATGNEFIGRELDMDNLRTLQIRCCSFTWTTSHNFTSPALFAGGRLDSGPMVIHERPRTSTTCSIMKALGSQKLGYLIATAILCEGVYVPEGPPALPLKAACCD